MLRIPFSVMSPAGPRGRLSILVFHRVLARADPLGDDLPVADTFEARMRWVRSWFNVLPLADAIEHLFSGTLPARALSITFDDGYADNEELAAPILKRLGMTATFFVATGFLRGGCMWNDQIIEAVRDCKASSINLNSIGLPVYSIGSINERIEALSSIIIELKHFEPEKRKELTQRVVAITGATIPSNLMMRPDQVRNLRKLGMDVGAHTVTHPILTTLSAGDAFAEMRDSKVELETILDEPVKLFAYPNGVPASDYASEHATMARDCGFSAAVSTAWGAASMRSDRFQLPRFTPWDQGRLRYGARLLSNFQRVEQTAT